MEVPETKIDGKLDELAIKYRGWVGRRPGFAPRRRLQTHRFGIFPHTRVTNTVLSVSFVPLEAVESFVAKGYLRDQAKMSRERMQCGRRASPLLSVASVSGVYLWVAVPLCTWRG